MVVAASSLLIALSSISTLAIAGGTDASLDICTSASGKAAVATCTRLIASGRYNDRAIARLLLSRGTGHGNAGDLPDALADYTQAALFDPTYALALRNRALIYGMMGDFGRAIKDFKQVLAVSPDDAKAKKWLAEAEKKLAEPGHKPSPSDQELAKTAKDLVAEGVAEDRKKNYTAAVSNLTKALGANPMLAEAYYWRADSHLGAKEWDAAIVDDLAAVKLEPRDSASQLALGIGYFSKGAYKLALARFRRASELDPNEPSNIFMAALAEEKLGDAKSASADYKRVLAIDPKDKQAAQHLAALGRKLHVKSASNPTPAPPTKGPAPKLSADEINSITRRCSDLSGAAEGRVSSCSKLISLNRFDGPMQRADVYYWRGLAYIKEGAVGYDKALADLNKAVEFGKGAQSALDKYSTADFYGARGDVHQWQNDMPAAIRDYERAVRLSNQSQYYVSKLKFARSSYESYKKEQAVRSADPVAYDCTKAGSMAARAAACDKLVARAGGDAGARASALAKRAAYFVYVGKLAEAAADLSAAIRLEPKVADYYAARAKIYDRIDLDHGRHMADGIADLTTALGLKPDNATYLAARGKAHMDLWSSVYQKKFDDAVMHRRIKEGRSLLHELDAADADFKSALQIDPHNAAAKEGLSLLALNRRGNDHMIKVWSAPKPKDETALRKPTSGECRGNGCAMLAVRATHNDRGKACLSIKNVALNERPPVKISYQKRGVYGTRCEVTVGSTEFADVVATACLEVDGAFEAVPVTTISSASSRATNPLCRDDAAKEGPGRPVLASGSPAGKALAAGDAALAGKEWRAAVAAYSKLVTLNTDVKGVTAFNAQTFYAWTQRGRAYEKLGLLALAYDDYLAAHIMVRQDSKVKASLDTVYNRIVAATADPARLIAEGEAAEKRGDLETAMDRYSQVIVAKKKSAPAYAARGLLREKRGDFKGAANDFSKAFDLAPERVDYLAESARATGRRGYWYSAVGDLEKATKLAPKDATIAQQLASARAELGRQSEALHKVCSGNACGALDMHWITGCLYLENKGKRALAYTLTGPAGKRGPSMLDVGKHRSYDVTTALGAFFFTGAMVKPCQTVKQGELTSITAVSR